MERQVRDRSSQQGFYQYIAILTQCLPSLIPRPSTFLQPPLITFVSLRPLLSSPLCPYLGCVCDLSTGKQKILFRKS